MRELETSDKIAVAVSRHYIRANSYDSNAKVHCFPNSANIRSDLVVLKMHERSVHHAQWNGLIQYVAESGIIGKWLRSSASLTRKSNESASTGEGIITIGIICFWFGGLVIATIVAIIEQIIHYKVKQPNHHRYWAIADMLIDGRRYMYFFNGNRRNRKSIK